MVIQIFGLYNQKVSIYIACMELSMKQRSFEILTTLGVGTLLKYQTYLEFFSNNTVKFLRN